METGNKYLVLSTVDKELKTQGNLMATVKRLAPLLHPF